MADRRPPLSPACEGYLASLVAAGRISTATTNRGHLATFTRWLAPRSVEMLAATSADLIAYRHYLAEEHRTPAGKPLALSTQETAFVIVRSCYRWLHRHGHIPVNPTARVQPMRAPKALTVAKDHLSQDEAVALVATLSDRVAAAEPASTAWALAVRNLALISLGIASGRRCGGLRSLRLADLDPQHSETRVEIEKGRTGRTLPLAAWAMALLKHYVARARPIILGERTSDVLFPTIHAPQMTHGAVVYLLDEAIEATIQRHPDLTKLPGKRITTHSLRVTFADIMFRNGCGIRSLNELLLHRDLNTTAQYTSIPLEDLRRVLLDRHPRA